MANATPLNLCQHGMRRGCQDTCLAWVQGKVGSAFTSVGGHGRGWGGHEAILSSFHAFFLQHGMVGPFPVAPLLCVTRGDWHPCGTASMCNPL